MRMVAGHAAHCLSPGQREKIHSEFNMCGTSSAGNGGSSFRFLISYSFSLVLTGPCSFVAIAKGNTIK